MTGPTSRKSVPGSWIALLAILLALGSVLCVNRYLEYRNVGAREQERLFAQAQVLGVNLSGSLSAVNDVLGALQKERLAAGPDAGLDRRLRLLAGALPGVRTLCVLDRDGTIRAASRPELPGRKPADRGRFLAAQAHPDPGALYVSPPFATSPGAYAVELTRVVAGPDGGLAGMVTATLDRGSFNTLFASVLYAPDMTAAVAHGDGTLFVLLPERPGLLGKNVAGAGGFFGRQLVGGRDSAAVAGTGPLFGAPRLLVWRSVQPAGLKMDRPLVVGVSREPRAVYARWRHENLAFGGLFLLVCALSALALGLYRRRQREFERQMSASALALRESGERLHLATSLAGLGVWERNLVTGTLVWDDSMLAIYGIDRGGFTGDYAAWRDRVFPEDLAAAEACVREAIAHGRSGSCPFRIRRGDGEVRWLKGTFRVYCDSVGTPQRLVGADEDITERQGAAEQLERALTEAGTASLAKSEFLANMSHEIRTPMNAILGLIYLLQKTGLNPRQSDYVAKVREAASSLLGILNDILDFSKVEAGRMELERVTFSLDDLLRNMAVILAANSQEQDVEVLFDLDPQVPEFLVGDPLRLQQVLLNLAGNAVKFTPEGEVVLSIGTVAREGERVTLEIAIRDTGIGIEPENLKRIFDGFTQAELSTSRRFGGTGLGLAICSRLIRLMGGEIEVESEQGKGSVFSFRAAFGIPPDAPPPPAAAEVRALRLIAVDDNETSRGVLAKSCAALGWELLAVGEGSAAVRLMEAAAGKPGYDALLLDWRLPGVAGVEAAVRLRQLCRQQATPVILLATSYGRESLEDEAQPASGEAPELLLKPWTRSMLVEAVADAGRSPRGGSAPAQSQRRFQGLRVLLAEDNKVSQQVAREILEGEGAKVVVADNGREALACLAARGMAFDVVLMDLQMPVLDGYQATRQIRETLGETSLPVIAMTANAFEADRQRCLEAGMNAHLSKPIEVETLVATLGRFCALPEAAAPTRPELVCDPFERAGLPGVDLADTLKRLDGNRRLYGQMARMVCDRYADAVRQAQRLWKGGHREEAARLLHTFKGVLLNLGAAAAGAFLPGLERALREGGGEEECAPLWARLEELWGEAAGSLQQVAARYGQAREEEAGTLAARDAQLQRLLALLQDSNMEALDCFDAFRRSFGAELPQERLAWIGEALEQLDFEAAHEYLSVLAAALRGEVT